MSQRSQENSLIITRYIFLHQNIHNMGSLSPLKIHLSYPTPTRNWLSNVLWKGYSNFYYKTTSNLWCTQDVMQLSCSVLPETFNYDAVNRSRKLINASRHKCSVGIWSSTHLDLGEWCITTSSASKQKGCQAWNANDHG